jgi:Ni,Fe-hydrogenase I cytochrome b subunit
MENLVYRHNCVTRTTYWINVLALLILVMSGLQIFNAHPHLYWGSRSELTEPRIRWHKRYASANHQSCVFVLCFQGQPKSPLLWVWEMT